MDFTLTDDQALIRDSAESFLAKNSDSASVRRAMESAAGYDATLWQRIGEELGWCATSVPEEYGGLGLSCVELTLLTEQMGRRLLCAPFFSTVCLAATALLETAGVDAKRRYLPEIAAGKLSAALGLAATGVDWDPRGRPATARKSDQQYLLSGHFGHVIDGATAQILLIPARVSNKWSLFAIPADASGVTRTPLATLDQTRRLAELRLTDVQVPADARIAEGATVAEGLARTGAIAAIALASEQVGGAQQCLDLTLAYVAERAQFGRKIASFQAVKHRCAEMMVKIEAARSAVYGAARAVSRELPTAELRLEAACAKVSATDAFFYCASEAIQLHGGVGFTWEYDPHLYFKRAQATSHWFGGSDALREQVAETLLGDAA